MKSFPNQWSKKGKLLECGLIYNRCKDTLCSPESKISEWFPTVTQGRLRIKALDPYGNMRLSSQKGNIRKKDFRIIYTCSVESCHATIVLRNIQPDNEGNEYGLYGCFEHQHKMLAVEEKRCEIVFKNKEEAKECFEKNGFGLSYKNTGFQPKQPLSENYICRRRALKKGLGYYPCKSFISILRSFKDYTLEEDEEKPFSLVGIFHHSHKDDERFHKNKHGGFRRNHDDPSLDCKRKKEIRIKNGKIFPIYARKYVTVEEILALKDSNGGTKRKDKQSASAKLKKGCAIATYMIDLDERIRNSALNEKDSVT